ncbi:NAD(P)H-binding protein [Lacibacter sp. MH-610]|uniref:NAD(P)H-binding protein n=1 Tax=Lacibacter sp. MH-610 TaxID=3020883 RepID=UPI0038927DDB
MKQQTAVVIGATGLTGSHLVQQLLADDAFNAVRILVRKPVALQHPKLQVELVDFNNYEDYKIKLGSGDCIFCCIGTTNSQVKGDEIAYRKIDFDIPVNAARFGKEAGFQQFAIITAATANSKSRIFYNRLKGEVEEVIATFQYQSFHIFRPSFIMGKRTEQRLGEKIFRVIFQTIAKLLPAAWRPIDAATIATAMINSTKKGRPGMNLYYYKEMLRK